MRTIVRLTLSLSLAVFLASLLPPSAAAKDLRHGARWGGSIGILAEPTPSVVSAGISYDLTPRFRLHAAAGGGAAPSFMESVQWGIYGAGVTYLFLPQKPLSPTIGASLNYAKLESSSPFLSIFGLEYEKKWTTVTTGFNAGLDWQTRVGFNAAIGAAVWIDTQDTPFRDVGIVPNLRFGWLF